MPEYKDELPVKDLKSLLQQSLGDEIEIQSADWKHLTDPGENFGSLILAIDVTLLQNSKTEVVHLVAKLPPPSPYLLKLFNSPFTFSKELAFYKDLTPAFLQLQSENGICNANESWLGPRYFGGRMGLKDKNIFDNQASIVLENLNYTGYKMIDRLIGLNKQQVQYAIKQLAKFHSLGVAMKKTKPKQFEELIMPALAGVMSETTKQCIGDMIKKSLDDLNNIPEAKPFMEIIYKSIELGGKIEANQINSKDDTWCTMIHNDFWVNNMMFKINQDNNIVDMKIVDFQLCGYDYGVKDLIFFLISSPSNEIIDDIFDDMVNLYYDSFIDNLRELNISVKEYTREKLIKLVENAAPLKLAQCLMMTQVIKSVPGTAANMEAINNKESFLQMGGGKAHYDKLLLVLNLFRKRGWLIEKSV